MKNINKRWFYIDLPVIGHEITAVSSEIFTRGLSIFFCPFNPSKFDLKTENNSYDSKKITCNELVKLDY